MATAMLAPAPYFSMTCYSGTTYTADFEGRISAAAKDVSNLLLGGCQIYPFNGVCDILLGVLIGANMNVTTDNIIPMTNLPASVSWQARRITVRNASTSLTTAAGGVYTAASKGGTALVASSQAYSALTTAAKCLDLTFAVTQTNAATQTSLYLNLTTAQGAAATADVYVYGEIVF
jgi:hypothetical protein